MAVAAAASLRKALRLITLGSKGYFKAVCGIHNFNQTGPAEHLMIGKLARVRMLLPII